MSDERILAEVLSIALHTRGFAATACVTDSPRTAPATPSPDVIILLSQRNSEQTHFQLTAVRAAFPTSKMILLGEALHNDQSRCLLDSAGPCLMAAESFNRLIRILDLLEQGNSPSLSDLESIDDRALHPIGGHPKSVELTVREQEIFKLISAGLGNKDIANFFSISTSTVKNHVHSILTKLNISRRSYALGRTYAPLAHLP